MWKKVRVYQTVSTEGWQSLVECTGLENRQALCGLGGSNPSPSAFLFCRLGVYAFERSTLNVLGLVRCEQTVPLGNGVIRM